MPRASPRKSARRRHQVAVLGGTFDHLHAGHRALLSAAFERADEVKVGLTTDAFARSERKPLARRVQSYATRRRVLREFLRQNFGRRRWSILPLSDPWGGSVRPGADLLVVSEETRRAARPINSERRRRGLAPLRIYVLPQVRAEDGRAIASRRIRAGEIDREGHLRHPLLRRVRTVSTKS
jgi:pantetheine-phosphate adenylyltransferase